MSDLNISLSSPITLGLDPGTDNISTHAGSKSELKPEKMTEFETKSLPANDVETAVQEVNAFLHNIQRNLSFRVDEELGEPIISVVDIETDQVIRQIPSEELVVLRKKMDDVTGILFDTKV